MNTKKGSKMKQTKFSIKLLPSLYHIFIDVNKNYFL